MFKDLGYGHIDIADNSFGYSYRCYLPQVGFGVSSVDYTVQETDILKNSDVLTEQMWVRPLLPSDFKSRRNKEKKAQEIDPAYVDPYLEEIRRREWRRRLLGVWFWNWNPITKESELVYITGLQYFYITYWKFQGKHMDFRMPDRDLFYVVAYCMQDPDCLGLNELTKRKNGKTARVGCWGYERVSRSNYHHAGLQSKSDDDAEEAFKKAVIHPWQKLPDFFRPRYDLMKGEEPNELRFFATARRGAKAEDDDDHIEEALESFFDFKPSTESAYDGPEVHTYISDEAGKTKKPVSIKERQNVVRYCTEIDGVMKGKHWQTTTVEPEKGEEENYEFQEVTNNSNPFEKNKNGRTGTGLYTYFLPAQKGMYEDADYAKYGFVNEEKNLEWLQNEIDAYVEKGDTRGLSSFKRKNPRSFKEAFSADGELALYDPELLNEQLDNISWGESPTEFGDLEWVNKVPFEIEIENDFGEKELILNKIIWVPNPKGRFERIKGWEPQEPNAVYKKNDFYFPNASYANRIGCDPFKYDKTKDKRRSNCAAYNYQMPDVPNSKFNDTFTLRYVYRAASTKLANEDILKMVWWCGTQVLFERNVNHWKEHFTNWKCGGFLMWLPGEVEPGIYTDGQGKVVQTICDYTEAFINRNIKNVFFKTLLRKDTGWLGFKVEDTQKFDEPMSAGITLIGVKNKKYAKKQEATRSIESYMPYKRAI